MNAQTCICADDPDIPNVSWLTHTYTKWAAGRPIHIPNASMTDLFSFPYITWIQASVDFHKGCCLSPNIKVTQTTLTRSSIGHLFRFLRKNPKVLLALAQIGLYMGPNNLCCVTPHFLSFFLCPMSLFIRNLLRHVTFYNTLYILMYIIIIFNKVFMSMFVFYKISTSILQFLKDFDVTFYTFYQGSRQILQLLKWPCHTSFFTHVEPY